MNRHLLAFLPALLLVLAGCTTSKQKSPEVYQAKVGSTDVTSFSPLPAGAVLVEPVTHEDVEKLNQPSTESANPAPDPYALHHRVFPNLLFKTEGKFFTSLHAGEFDRLREIIAENYGESYAKAMRMKSVSLPDIVFVTFVEPARPPLCYHVALVKKGDTFLFLTLEKSEDILAMGLKTAFCGWSPEGNHLNYGPRKYTSLGEFEEEVRAFLAKQEQPEPAAITTPR